VARKASWSPTLLVKRSVPREIPWTPGVGFVLGIGHQENPRGRGRAARAASRERRVNRLRLPAAADLLPHRLHERGGVTMVPPSTPGLFATPFLRTCVPCGPLCGLFIRYVTLGDVVTPCPRERDPGGR
jgi:hypothetical protein